MGYYHCRNCFCCFKTAKYVVPGVCPRCNNNHCLHEIQKSMYLEWIQLGEDSRTWRELKELERHNKMYDFARIIWDGYNRSHKGGD